MSENSKSLGFHKSPSSVSPQVLEKTETYLNRLLTAKESDPDTVETIQRLARELDENPAMAEIFLKKVMARGGDFFPWFLPDLNSRIHSKPAQKGIKRAIYLFKQKGIELPSLTDLQSKHEGGILKNIEPFQATGYLSEFDGLRNQMVGLLIPKPAKGRLFAFTLIGSEGLESLQALEVSKREVKDIIADMERRSGLVFLEADFRHAAFILKEAHDRQSKLPHEEEGVYSGILSLLEGKKMVGRTPIMRSLLNNEKLSPHSSDIQKLLQVPEIFYLLPEPGLIQSHLQAVQEVRTGLLILNENQKKERLMAVFDRAVQELFPPQKRAGLKRFLEEAAYLYYLKKRPDQAEALFYWANTMDEENGSRLGEGNPLLLWLMKTVLLAEEDRKTPTPEQKEQISEGGIILPSWVRTEEETR